MDGRRSYYAHVGKVACLFALALGAFVLIRWWFLPADFGVHGFYRAGALDDNRARVPVYAGRAACVDCHSDVVESRKGSRHEPIGCESCHGPLAAHQVPTRRNRSGPTPGRRIQPRRTGRQTVGFRKSIKDHAPGARARRATSLTIRRSRKRPTWISIAVPARRVREVHRAHRCRDDGVGTRDVRAPGPLNYTTDHWWG
jgi:hypothetical protein